MICNCCGNIKNTGMVSRFCTCNNVLCFDCYAYYNIFNKRYIKRTNNKNMCRYTCPLCKSVSCTNINDFRIRMLEYLKANTKNNKIINTILVAFDSIWVGCDDDI